MCICYSGKSRLAKHAVMEKPAFANNEKRSCDREKNVLTPNSSKP